MFARRGLQIAKASRIQTLTIMKAPHEGAGLHDFILEQSRRLLIEGRAVDEAVSILLEAAKDSNRTTQDIEGEIRNAVEGASAWLDENPGVIVRRRIEGWVDPHSFIGLDDGMVRKDRRPNPSKKLFDEGLRAEAIRKGRGYISFNEGAGFRWDILFGGIDFLICPCRDKWSGPIKRLREWNIDETFPQMQFIVPNCFYSSSKEGAGKCDFNAGERLFVVVEFDSGDARQQKALLASLEGNGFRLFMIVFSGHQSYHGWFTAYGITAYKVKTFCIRASKIGADKTTFSPSQYVRMPGGFNYEWNPRQEIRYFDGSKLEQQNELLRRELL
jgi:hypothetical protein